ncbi:hypothetical protein D3C87_69180 [compost metagenome]
MTKSDYIFIGITIVFYIFLSFIIHDFIKISGKLLGAELSFSTSPLETLILATIPFLSYILSDRIVKFKQFSLTIIVFIIITFVTLLLSIYFASKISIKNPLIPQYLIIIPYKYYFSIVFSISIILAFSLIKIKNVYSKKLT